MKPDKLFSDELVMLLIKQTQTQKWGVCGGFVKPLFSKLMSLARDTDQRSEGTSPHAAVFVSKKGTRGGGGRRVPKHRGSSVRAIQVHA